MCLYKGVGEFLADKIAEFIGSWVFIIIQSTILIIWILLNVFNVFNFDHYPFILLNLFLSFEAAYATPLILMSANRSAERDRQHLLRDLELDEETIILVKSMADILNKVSEDIRIDKKAIEILNEAKEERAEMRENLEKILNSIERKKSKL